MNRTNIKNFLLKASTILFIMLIVSSVQIYILTLFRKYGNLSFGNFEHHIAVLTLYLISLISTLFCWNKSFIKTKNNSISKIFIVFVLSLVVFFILSFLIEWFSKFFLEPKKYTFYSIALNAYSLTIMFHPYSSGFTLTYLYFNQSKKTAIALEQTEKEKTTLQSQMLQKNLEPHFLFNNLNVLSGLAKSQPEKIDSFIDSFSDVYRYYLKYQQKEIVSLTDELQFLNRYMELMQKRFGNAYQIKNEIENTDGFIIPFSLQLCIENAIKHNKASEKHPLIINLSRDNQQINIQNKLNKVDFTIGNKTGNLYLQRQYEINFNKSVIFSETKTDYIVKIPII